jgi:hypothetical protein
MIVENLSVLAPFAALSHQWGGSELLRTTLANIQQRRSSIAWQELSETIQDLYPLLEV